MKCNIHDSVGLGLALTVVVGVNMTIWRMDLAIDSDGDVDDCAGVFVCDWWSVRPAACDIHPHWTLGSHPLVHWREITCWRPYELNRQTVPLIATLHVHSVHMWLVECRTSLLQHPSSLDTRQSPTCSLERDHMLTSVWTKQTVPLITTLHVHSVHMWCGVSDQPSGVTIIFGPLANIRYGP